MILGPQVDVESSHRLVIRIVKSILKGHFLLPTVSQVSQSHRSAQIVGMRQTGEYLDPFLGQRPRAQFRAMAPGQKSGFSRRNQLKGADVVSDGQQPRVVLPQVARQVHLQPRAVDHVAVQAGVVVVNLEHVVIGAAVILAHGVTGLLGEEEGFAAQTPGGHDALAFLEVVGHVGGVALVAAVDVMIESSVRVSVVVTLVHHHVMHVSLAAGGQFGLVADHVMLARQSGQLNDGAPIEGVFRRQVNPVRGHHPFEGLRLAVERFGRLVQMHAPLAGSLGDEVPDGGFVRRVAFRVKPQNAERVVGDDQIVPVAGVQFAAESEHGSALVLVAHDQLVILAVVADKFSIRSPVSVLATYFNSITSVL